MADESWRLEAACREKPTALFFSERAETVAEAKAVCADCPVRSECLAFAQKTKQSDGIWGGFDEDERRKLRRKPRGPRLGQGKNGTEARRVAEALAKGYEMERCHRCGELYAAHRLHNHLAIGHRETHTEECPECHKQIRSSRIVGHMSTHWGYATENAQRKRLQRARARQEEAS
jgi:WhiB family redox-sensing transcriptional regulator